MQPQHNVPPSAGSDTPVAVDEGADELDLDFRRGATAGDPRRSLGARMADDGDDAYWDEYFPFDATATRFNLSVVRVTAVMVTRNAERWLPRALRSIADLKHRPERMIVVDNESTDATLDLLEQAKADGIIDVLVAGDAGWGFGQAVAAGLAAAPAADARDDREEWLWLLHDDVVVAADSLSKLIKAGLRGTGGAEVDILGPKLLQASRRHSTKRLSELGMSISPTATREPAHEAGEVDQDQHDAEDVLGVSTCGLYIRRTAWDRLGGFDPAVPLFRDGVELGWRARLAGLRVRTCPEAVIVHQQVGRAGLRPGMTSATALDRGYGMITVAAHRRGLRAVLTSIRLVLHTLLRALGFLLGKAPSRALDEVRGIGTYLAGGGRTRALRKRVFAIQSTADTRAAAERLRPGWRQGWAKASSGIAGWVGDAWSALFGPDPIETSLDELTGENEFAGHAPQRRRPWLAPTMLVLAGLGVLTLVAGRVALRGGHLTAPQLLPAQSSWTSLWHSYTHAIPGAPGMIAPPWLGMAALSSLATLGQVEWLMALLWFGCVPISAALAWWFFRRLAVDPRGQLVGAVAYGTLPASLAALNRGNLTVMVWALVLPLLGLAVLGWRRRGLAGFESWRNVFGTALALTVLGAFTPVILGVALVAALVSALVARKAGQLLRALVAVGVPALVLSPWLPTLLRYPGRFLTGAEPLLASTAEIPTVPLLLGRTPGSGLPPMWLSLLIFGLVWLVSLVGAWLRPRAALPWLGAAALAFATAVGVSRLIVAVPPTGGLARPSATPWLLIAFAALICCAVLGFDTMSSGLRERDFGARHIGALLALALAGVAALAGVGWWVVGGATGPVHRDPLTGLPSAARQAQLSTMAPRTLVIDLQGGQPRWTLSEGDGARLGDSERGITGGGSTEIRELASQVAAQLASRSTDSSVADRLAKLGVGHVVLRHGSPETIAAISSTPGLGTAVGDERQSMWRVTGSSSRAVMVVGDDQTPIDANGTHVEPGASGRYLVLAEPSDPRWVVTLDGQRLREAEKADGDYRPRYQVGEHGGQLAYHLRSVFPWWAWAQFAALIILGVLAAPSLKRLESRDPAQYARRASRLGDGATRKERTR